MKWNDGKERSKFKREQEELREEYLKAGMTEEQIQAMYLYDYEQYNKRRREAMHTQALDLYEFEEEKSDDTKSPLFKKFGDKLTEQMDEDFFSRYEWIEEVESEKLYMILKNLSIEELELLTLIYKENYKQIEVAKLFSVSQSKISKKIKKLLKFIEKME